MALFNVLLDIQARTGNMEAGIKRTEDLLTHLGSTVADVGKKFLEFAGVAIGLDAIKNSIEGAVEKGEQLELLSKRLNTTTEFLSQMQFAAKSSQVDFQAFANGLDVMNKAVSMAADGTGRAQKAIKELGLDATTLNALPLDQKLNVISDALASIGNSTDKNRIAMQIFGDPNLISIIGEGASKIAEFEANSDKLGNTLSTNTAENLVKVSERITQLKTVADNFWRDTANNLAQLGQAAGIIPIDEMEKTKTELSALTQQMELLKKGLIDIKNQTPLQLFIAGGDLNAAQKFQTAITDLAPKIDILKQKLKGLQDQTAAKTNTDNSFLAFDIPYIDGQAKSVDDVIQKMNDDIIKSYDERNAAIEKANIDFVQQQKQADLLLTGDDILKGIEETHKEVQLQLDSQLKTMADTYKSNNEELIQISQTGAQGIQTAFSDYLFDPAAKGFNGLADDFLTAIRRMIADAAAVDLFKALFGQSNTDKSTVGLSNIFSSLLGAFGGSSSGSSGAVTNSGDQTFFGNFATGGSFAVAGAGGTDSQRISFNATPGERVTVSRPGQMGGDINFSYSIDARGATQDVIKALPSMMKQTHDSAVATIQDMKRRGRL